MNKPIKIALCCVLALMLIFSGYKIIDILLEYGNAEAAYDETIGMAVSEVEPSGTDIVPPVAIDFETLCAENEDIVGWIYCEGTVINYPVVQSDDNSYYLRRMPDGTRNNAGSIFMDFRCAADCSDSNTIIYGHNMKNGTMFATLKKYKSQNFYDEHPVMWFFTPEQTYMVEIVASYTTSTGSEVFDVFWDEEGMSDYLRRSAEKSYFKTDLEIESVERIITLSTCSYEYDNARYVLIGSLVPIDTEIQE